MEEPLNKSAEGDEGIDAIPNRATAAPIFASTSAHGMSMLLESTATYNLEWTRLGPEVDLASLDALKEQIHAEARRWLEEHDPEYQESVRDTEEMLNVLPPLSSFSDVD